MALDDPADPKPQPPRVPTQDECCGGGCEPCVYDRYYDALDRYEEALAAWGRRHPEAAPDPEKPSPRAKYQ